MSTTFETYLQERTPGWLLRANGVAYVRGIATLCEEMLSRAKQGVKARLLEYTYDSDADRAPADALELAGGERSIRRARYATTETDSAYANRLKGAWDEWKWSGTPYGMLRALSALGYTCTVIQQSGRRFSLSGSNLAVVNGSPWTFSTSGWNRFAVAITSMPASWAGTPPSSSSNEALTLIETVKLWKPAHAICDSIIIATGPVWGLTMTWGSFTWGGGTATTWTVNA